MTKTTSSVKTRLRGGQERRGRKRTTVGGTDRGETREIPPGQLSEERPGLAGGDGRGADAAEGEHRQAAVVQLLELHVVHLPLFSEVGGGDRETVMLQVCSLAVHCQYTT